MPDDGIGRDAGGIAWRFAVLGGATGGLALSPAAPAGSAGIARRCWRSGWPRRWPGRRAPGRPWRGARVAWLALVALAAAAAGLAVGALRLAAIDRGAFDGPVGGRRRRRGIRDRGSAPIAAARCTVRIQTGDGRLAVEAASRCRTFRSAARCGDRHAARARALGGGLPGALRHPRGARAPGPVAAHRPAARRARGARRSASAIVRAAALGSGTPERRGGAPARASARRGRPHRPGHGRRLQALRARPPTCGLRRERDAPRACSAMPLWRSRACRCAPRLVCAAGADRVYVPVTGAGPSIQRAGRHGRRGGGRGARRAAPLALVRDPRSPPSLTLGDQPASQRRRRLAAQLRGGDRDPAVGGADSGDLPTRRPGRRHRITVGRRRAPRRGRRGDDRRHALHGPADGASTSRRSRSPRCPRTCWRCPRWRR